MFARLQNRIRPLIIALVVLFVVILAFFWWRIRLRKSSDDVTSHFLENIEFEYSSAQLYMSMADHLQREEGRFSKAEEMYEEAIKSFDRSSAMVRAIQTVAFVENQDYESAYKYSDEALARWGSNMELVALHTMCARELGKEEILDKLKEKARQLLVGADDYHIQLMNSAFQEDVVQKKSTIMNDSWQRYFLQYLRDGGESNSESPDRSEMNKQQKTDRDQ